MNIKIEPAPGHKCNRCFIVREKTVSLFGDQICHNCFNIIFQQLFNNEISFKYNDEKEKWTAVMNPYDEFTELTSSEVLEIIKSHVLEEERTFINSYVSKYRNT